jgi:Alpha/beta hydrolase domain
VTTRDASFQEIPGKAPDLMSEIDIAALGYEETEFLVDGRAESFQLQGERGADGRWDVSRAAGADFQTRILVRRPSDRERFSGTVVVEWNNVSAGIDASPDWLVLHRHLVAQGHAWVGVSAQKAGIDGGGIAEGIHLKLLAPDRYDTLAHPGDAWSFDIFSQVAKALRRAAGENPLGGLEAEHVLAMGESQSAACLVTYINAIDPLARVFDGFFVHGRTGTGVAIDGSFLPVARSPAISEAAAAISGGGERIRDDVRVPVLVFQSETDVVFLGGGRADQRDSDHVRVWELAGAAHADTYMASAGRRDDGTLSAARLAELMRPTCNLMIATTRTPINAGPQQHYVGQAALSSLTRWVRAGTPPPQAPRLALDASGTGLSLDAHGNAAGGIRTPWVEVPTAVLSGLGQTGELFAVLFGRTDPFDDATLSALYPGGKTEYLQQFETSLDKAIAEGFILSQDRAEILEVAAASYPLVLAEG